MLQKCNIKSKSKFSCISDIISAPSVIIKHARCRVTHVPYWSIINPNRRQMKFVAPADIVKIRLYLEFFIAKMRKNTNLSFYNFKEVRKYYFKKYERIKILLMDTNQIIPRPEMSILISTANNRLTIRCSIRVSKLTIFTKITIILKILPFWNYQEQRTFRTYTSEAHPKFAPENNAPSKYSHSIKKIVHKLQLYNYFYRLSLTCYWGCVQLNTFIIYKLYVFKMLKLSSINL